MNNVFRGCMPALMTPCNDDYSPNFELLVVKMIGQNRMGPLCP